MIYHLSDKEVLTEERMKLSLAVMAAWGLISPSVIILITLIYSSKMLCRTPGKVRRKRSEISGCARTALPGWPGSPQLCGLCVTPFSGHWSNGVFGWFSFFPPTCFWEYTRYAGQSTLRSGKYFCRIWWLCQLYLDRWDGMDHVGRSCLVLRLGLIILVPWWSAKDLLPAINIARLGAVWRLERVRRREDLRKWVVFQQRLSLFKTFYPGSRLSSLVAVMDVWLMGGCLYLGLCLLIFWRNAVCFPVGEFLFQVSMATKKADFTAVRTYVRPRSQELSSSLLTNTSFSSCTGWQGRWAQFFAFFRTFSPWGGSVLPLDTKTKPTNQPKRRAITSRSLQN